MFSPHSGGIKISPNRKAEVESRIRRYADLNLKDRCEKIDVHFRGALCYIAAYQKESVGNELLLPLCRLRHFDLEKWSMALFTWSRENYEPCIFPSGEWFGTIEECIELGSTGALLSKSAFSTNLLD